MDMQRDVTKSFGSEVEWVSAVRSHWDSFSFTALVLVLFQGSKEPFQTSVFLKKKITNSLILLNTKHKC